MKKVKIGKREMKNWAWAYALIAPTVLLIIILNVWPIIQTVWYSFQNAKGMKAPSFVGLSNYVQIVQDESVWRALKNSAFYAICTVPIGVAISLITAVFLNTSIRAKGFFRVLYFLPVISAPAAITMVWRWLFNSEYGIVNFVLGKMGIQGPNWIGEGKYLMFVVMIIGIWTMIGYNMVILLAGLQSIPRSYYEASEIDGAGAIRKFWNITVPLVTPTLFFVVLTSMISALQVFDIVFMMLGRDNPAKRTSETLVYLFYERTFVQYNQGYGSAIAVLILIIILILTAVQFKLQKKWVHYQ